MVVWTNKLNLAITTYEHNIARKNLNLNKIVFDEFKKIL